MKLKICVYSYRSFDEKTYFDHLRATQPIALSIHEEAPSLENYHYANGHEHVSILTAVTIDRPLIEAFASIGVKHLSTRSVGFDHIDLAAAKACGIAVSHGAYPPESVANYTIMSMLMVSRQMKQMMERSAIQDFTLKGLLGRDFSKLVIGVIGTGKIGATVIKQLQGFGNQILAYSLFEDESLKSQVTYVSLEELLEQADIITLHTPLDKQNYHLLDEAAFEKMKPGVMIINTARGGLIDAKALMQAVVSGKVGGALLDVVEEESGLYYNDLKGKTLNHHDLMLLKSYPSIMVTPHMAFYTEASVEGMVTSSMMSCLAQAEQKDHPWKVNLDHL